jgi:CMP-N,N'-diacetyllegionaminic acid synthase
MLAIIPARGGSKRLLRKNILPLAGRPVIAWTIEAALKSSAVKRVVVSTDDPEIAAIAKSFGAEVPFLRESELASDTTSTIDVVVDTLKRLTFEGRLVLLQPTSPLRTAMHIDEAANLMTIKSADGVVSVTKAEHPLEWFGLLPDDGCMRKFLDPGVRNLRSQDLPVSYRLNGAIYIAESRKLIEEGTFFLRKNVYAYRMERESSVDIDDEFDYRVADMLLKDRLHALSQREQG